VRIRGLVLAAGHAQRLRPLSRLIPKPLLPLKGVPVLVKSLQRLKEAGCEALAVNLHHLGSTIEEELKDGIPDCSLHFSREESILGTLGALIAVREFLAPADLVVVVNGDSLCHWPVEALVKRHQERAAACTMLFSRQAEPRSYGGGVLVQGEEAVVSFRKNTELEEGRRFVFAGSYILEPHLLARVGPGHSNLVPDLLVPLLSERARVSALVYDGSWHDLGTPRRYLDACLREAAPWSHVSAKLGKGCRVDDSVLESSVRVKDEASIESSVILPGATVGRGSRLTRCLLGPGVQVPENLSVVDKLITPDAKHVIRLTDLE
jgi:NDP-sugar pyrophosphorylase family protein